MSLFSTSAGSYGSCISLCEIMDGLLADKWSLIRQTSVGGKGLRFNYGLNKDPSLNNTVMYLDDNGEVGIGTANPGAALEVAGQVKITGGSPGAGKVLTSNSTGLASWQVVTTEYWFSPLQLVGTYGSTEVTPDANGYVKIWRPDAAGIAVVTLYLDLPGKISGLQQKLQGVTFHYMMPEFSERILWITLKRLNTDGTATTIWHYDGPFLWSHTWTSYTYTDPDPDPITGPVTLRFDIEYSNPGPGFEVYLGSVKVWTTE